MRRRFSIAADAEVTLEANPRDLDADGYRAPGRARREPARLGIQSFDDAVCDMGRLHDASHARRAFAWARVAGLASISVDLVLGWPGETPERWSRSLESVSELHPDHVSLYVLWRRCSRGVRHAAPGRLRRAPAGT